MTKRKIDAHAYTLFEQHRDAAVFTPFVGDAAIENVAEAYEIQRALVELELAHFNVSIVGYKIGLTSERMQALLGIDSPIAGVVLGNRIHQSGVQVNLSDYVKLGIECEIAVRLGSDLAATDAPFNVATIAQVIDAVCPAFELIDDRAADYSVTDIASLIADNSWNAGIVLGQWSSEWPNLATLDGVVKRNGEILDRGNGADVLGHPFAALAWLANHLSHQDRGLKAGDVVATGSIVPTRAPSGPESCVFDIEQLGEVSVAISD